MQCRLGEFAIAATGRQEFEIIQLLPDGLGAAVARFSVDETELPRLKLEKLDRDRRNLGPMDDSPGPVVLDSHRNVRHDTNFELSVIRMENGVEIHLSGDHHRQSPRRFQVFLWRAECVLVDGQPTLRGPYLLRDLDS
jgi:hypothetical protein